MTKLTQAALEKHLWGAADILRGTVDVEDYKQYIFGLLFYVWPNHGRRHRFKAAARMVRMDPEVRDYIQGHRPRTEGEAYGYVRRAATFHEIELFPRSELPAKGGTS
ncbi:type I restriction-modification system subunit M N-terminal domain-containing protein [Novosphingobium sp. 1949]|uniref:Type I restriction-modification system subunit M N-terminal domain-containing protein n=1 Tax=Novosphingobium organovorum TaxID=2930092 RepID=A0ABT0BFT2_9SPHN|nr:type I restriction-modification system subunit M N-terminal domain-containing protein [Novosphingobium organovorum]MCJ2183925.1 type I restriction-modification system subunit M N-terminal domain-containing protein [Novosphingobium organovorum]